jgi:hypothetical protein|tara:strand:+ start:2331 stop:2738 length:408 start_codon:yes stop_codon:yes gene_type:complete
MNLNLKPASLARAEQLHTAQAPWQYWLYTGPYAPQIQPDDPIVFRLDKIPLFLARCRCVETCRGGYRIRFKSPPRDIRLHTPDGHLTPDQLQANQHTDDITTEILHEWYCEKCEKAGIRLANKAHRDNLVSSEKA